jgi:transcriptional regulator with XRE-family HTH domain
MGETSTETIERILSSYEIGQKLRRLRLRKKVALVDLGRHTGLSASLLSQLENGKMVPTLPTLARIAMVFDVGLDHFFADRKNQKLFTISRAQDRIKFPERPDVLAPGYFFECLAYSAQEKSMQAYRADFVPRDITDTALHFHDGSEMIFITEGGIGITFMGEEHVLRAGDCVYFDASEPHGYRGLPRTGGSGIVITVPLHL